MNKSQNQPQEECSNYLPPIHSVSVEAEFEGMTFNMTFNIIIQQVISNVSACINQVNLCGYEHNIEA